MLTKEVFKRSEKLFDDLSCECIQTWHDFDPNGALWDMLYEINYQCNKSNEIKKAMICCFGDDFLELVKITVEAGIIMSKLDEMVHVSPK